MPAVAEKQIRFPTKVKAVKIIIDRAEGLAHECRKTEHVSWREAEERISQIRRTAPKEGGYDKCDFQVIFADGDDYKGRYDAKHWSIADEGGLASHINSYLNFLAGNRCPAHMTQDEYEKAMAVREHRIPGIRQQAIDFLATYEIGA